MNITILTVGSRGDVQPYIALGLGLREAGYSVRIATHRNFRELIHRRGLEFAPIEGDPRQIFEQDVGQKLLTADKGPITLLQRTFTAAQPILFQVFDDYWRACQDADLLLFHVLAALPAASIAEKLGIPAYPAYLQHVHATRAYPSPMATPLPLALSSLDGTYNRLTYAIGDWAFWRIIRPLINRWRERTLGLPPYPRQSPFKGWQEQPLPFLYGFSPSVVPPPAEWGERVHVTGYWFLDGSADWQPPAALTDFLASGPPPVYIGFGSMVNRNPEETAEIALRALALSGQRGLLLTGWGGIRDRDLPDEIFKLDSAPHDWLFPRMAAVVHHGGAGTTAAGLRAGVPTVVIPFFGDQPFWGRRVADLGVGVRPIPRRRLSAGRLAAAIERVVHDEALRGRAAALGRQIRAEDGVRQAVRVLRRHLAAR
ncbi:MAG: glycosyltransferase family 1 protein [Chloroflexi bacterium]|nr:glycosyltransferase family 1 protein [Chloroflexota bacterium]